MTVPWPARDFTGEFEIIPVGILERPIHICLTQDRDSANRAWLSDYFPMIFFDFHGRKTCVFCSAEHDWEKTYWVDSQLPCVVWSEQPKIKMIKNIFTWWMRDAATIFLRGLAPFSTLLLKSFDRNKWVLGIECSFFVKS